MTKQKYIALLTEGKLEKEIHDAVMSAGYTLKSVSNFDGHITNHYVKNYYNLENVHDITSGKG